ncbi:MAG TPA: TetR-like C-terminal domain-containing protein [Kaistiaceae bacterium]|nr:TetR-like C-terminal domain-containing protein [Kaistiaceae bacterium]
MNSSLHCGIGLAYVAFAREEPRLFQLMLAVPPPAGACEKACGPAAAPGAEDSAYGQLRAVVRRYLGGAGAAREDVIERCCDFLWVIAHGLASIEATTGWQRSRDDLVAILEMGLATLDAERRGGR